MIMWTVVPMDIVFYQSEPPPAYEELIYAGTNMLVEKLSPTQCRIVRILTTNPADYLRPEIQPGTVLNYQPSPE
jgi:hypothetical protein